MIWGLSNDLIVFTNGETDTNKDFIEKIQKHKINLYEEKITSLTQTQGSLESVNLSNGSSIRRDALFTITAYPVHMKSDFGESLGCEKTEMGIFKVKDQGRASIDGVFVAGDISTMAHSVLHAAALGQLAGAGAVSDLLNEDFNA